MDRIRREEGKGKKEKERKSSFVAVILFSFILLPLSFFLLFWWQKGWNGSDPENIVISSGSDLWVLALRPKEHRLVEIRIPGETVIHPLGRGQLQARALWQVSQLEHQPDIISLAGTALLQVPVDHFYRIPDWSGIESLHLRSLIESTFADVPSLIRLYWYARSARKQGMTFVDLSTLPSVRHVVDPGDTKLLEVDQEAMSPLISDWFTILDVRTKGLTVAVLSTQKISGLGANIAKQMEHSGLRVISVKNGDKEQGIYIRSDTVKNEPLVRHLALWFQKRIVVSDFDERADILVVQ